MKQDTISLREPISWVRGLSRLKAEKDLSKRKQIVEDMQQHRDFKADVQRFRAKAEQRRRRRK